MRGHTAPFGRMIPGNNRLKLAVTDISQGSNPNLKKQRKIDQSLLTQDYAL
jgi:hypothetical protein